MRLKSAEHPAIYYEVDDFSTPWATQLMPILFIHGLHSSSRHWFRQVSYFARSRAVVTIDLRGHGRSDQPETGYAIKDHLQDILRVLDNLGLHRLHVVGGSMGGWLGQQLAATRPDEVCSLTLVGSSVRVPAVLDPEAVAAGIRTVGARAFFADAVRRRTLPADANAESGLIEFVVDIAAGQPDAVVAQRAFEGLRYDGARDLARVRCPVLILTGEHDGTTPPDCVEELHRLLPRGRRGIVPGCGHLPHLEDPDAFNSILDRFLRAAERNEPQGG